MRLLVKSGDVTDNLTEDVVTRVKAGSQYDARPCVSLRCVSVLYCEDDVLLLTPSDAM